MTGLDWVDSLSGRVRYRVWIPWVLLADDSHQRGVGFHDRICHAPRGQCDWRSILPRIVFHSHCGRRDDGSPGRRRRDLVPPPLAAGNAANRLTSSLYTYRSMPSPISNGSGLSLRLFGPCHRVPFAAYGSLYESFPPPSINSPKQPRYLRGP